MPRPSHYGQHPRLAAPPWERPKDPMRGIDPDRIDGLSRALDRTMAQMCDLAKSGKPIRGAALGRLAELGRALALQVESFNGDVELAL